LNTVAAGLLGLLLGLALAYLAQRLDRRVHDPETVEEILGKPVIASVPRARSLVQALAGPSTIEAAPAEAFRTLRTNLRYFDLGRPIKSIVVASAMEGEGKSTVAWYLAAAAAETGADVLLIEADLRRPTFAERLPTSLGGPGLAQAIAEGSPLRTVARRTQTTADDIAFSSEIDVVPAGDMPPNPSELLASPVARELISDAVAAYDLVVIDTPPATVVSDATPLMSIADAVLVVVRLRRTRRDRLAQLRDLLDSLGAPLIGAVVNDAKTHARYGYEYKARAPSSRTRGVGERDRGRPIGARSADATDSQERESGVTRMQS
jgi:capsular exopolysaccharide synthesis family protein